jgi:hypothetical protein
VIIIAFSFLLCNFYFLVKGKWPDPTGHRVQTLSLLRGKAWEILAWSKVSHEYGCCILLDFGLVLYLSFSVCVYYWTSSCYTGDKLLYFAIPLILLVVFDIPKWRSLTAKGYIYPGAKIKKSINKEIFYKMSILPLSCQLQVL